MMWISVKDRLPKVRSNATEFELASGESEKVLIWMDGPHVATYHVHIDKWSIPFFTGDWRPTYWQPIEPPQSFDKSRIDVIGQNGNLGTHYDGGDCV